MPSSITKDWVAAARPEGNAKVANHTSTEIEALAQALYEASDPKGVAWVRRGRSVRDAWLDSARRKLAEAGADASAKGR